MIMFPILLFMQLAQATTWSKYLIIAFFWLPIMPACALLIKLSEKTETVFDTMNSIIT